MKRSYYLLCSLLLGPLVSVAQDKYEREYRVPMEAVPVMARSFVDSCQFERRVRWYREESIDGHSFEAKVKEQGRRYSIEFDTLGQIQDVELLSRWNELPALSRSAMEEQLGTLFNRFRLKRIQQQWTGTRIVLLQAIRGQVAAGIELRYELVVRGRGTDGVQWYEFLFSASGQEERRSAIVFRNTDNLDY